jgi:hypothetical protein
MAAAIEHLGENGACDVGGLLVDDEGGLDVAQLLELDVLGQELLDGVGVERDRLRRQLELRDERALA